MNSLIKLPKEVLYTLQSKILPFFVLTGMIYLNIKGLELIEVGSTMEGAAMIAGGIVAWMWVLES